MTTKIVKRDDIELWTESLGNPVHPAVLLIGGAGSHAHFWTDTFCSSLIEAGFFVIRFDHRDTGLSSGIHFEKTPYDLMDLANDSLAILDAYGIAKAHIVGHSMGGYISQLIAAHFGERVLSVSILSAGPVGTTPEIARSFTVGEKAIFSKTWLILFSNHPSQQLEESWKGYRKVWAYLNGKLPLDDEMAKQYTEELYSRSKHPVGMHHSHVAVMLKTIDSVDKRKDIFPRIKAKTLVIHGEEDYLVLPQRGGISIAKAIPQAELVLVPLMGHMLFNHSLEKQISEKVTSFLQAASLLEQNKK